MLGAVTYSGSHYEFVLNLVRGMIEGTVDVFAFENELHKALDSSAYMAFTVEKILQNIVRQVSKPHRFSLSVRLSSLTDDVIIIIIVEIVLEACIKA